MPKQADAVELTVGTRTVRLSSPDRVYFPAHGWTKLDVAHYYLAVGDGILMLTDVGGGIARVPFDAGFLGA